MFRHGLTHFKDLVALRRSGGSPVVRFEEQEGPEIRGVLLVDACGRVLGGGVAQGLLDQSNYVGMSLFDVLGSENAKALAAVLSARSSQRGQVKASILVSGVAIDLFSTAMEVGQQQVFSVILASQPGRTASPAQAPGSPSDDSLRLPGALCADGPESMEHGNIPALDPSQELQVQHMGSSAEGQISWQLSESPDSSPRHAAQTSGSKFRKVLSGGSAVSFSYSASDGSEAEVPQREERGVQAEPGELGVSIGTQTTFATVKPPLLPGAIRAEDAARAAAHALSAEKKHRWRGGPFEGVWTILADHERQVELALLRLNFKLDVVVDNLGNQQSLAKVGDRLLLGSWEITLEGRNLLHLELSSGRRVSYTRGAGAFEVGRPVGRSRSKESEGGSSGSASTEQPSSDKDFENLLPMGRVSSVDIGDISELLKELELAELEEGRSSTE